MSLSDLFSIGSLISSFAVLISLIYLGLQVRPQSAGFDPAGAWRTRAVDIILAAGDPALAEALPKGTAGAKAGHEGEVKGGAADSPSPGRRFAPTDLSRARERLAKGVVDSSRSWYVLDSEIGAGGAWRGL